MPLDSRQHEKNRQRILKWCKNNADAADFIMDIAQLARDMDDVKDDGADVIDAVVARALINIAQNPFYQNYSKQLSAAIWEALVYWKLSDELKKSDNPKHQMYGFVIRESTDRIAVVVACILGGLTHGLWVAKDVLEFCYTTDETVADWVKEE